MAKSAPNVRVRSRGQVSGILEMYAAAYRKRYPERAVRYVYDPEHRKELSGVLGRMAQGYQLVTFGELDLGVAGFKDEDTVRVSDLVLMSIPAEEKEELVAERQSYATEQRRSVEREYYQKIEQAANENSNPNHTRPGATPIGRASIQEREFEYDIEQRSGDTDK